MPDRLTRRRFFKNSAFLAGLCASSFEERALLARSAATPVSSPESSPSSFPAGKIKNLTVTRLICGGNLISGFAHSRDLIYVSPLLRHYFTDEKVCDTLELCEEHGINSAILRVDSHVLRIIKKYRRERGGTIQWLAQAKPSGKDILGDVKKAVDNGAVAVYLQGGVGDNWTSQGRMDLVAKVLDYIKSQGVVSGLGGHALSTIVAYEKAGLEPDFYMKTLNSKNYWSGPRLPKHDNVWADTPEKTIEFMKKVKRPWIAFKVLAAGAIHPREGFKYAFENGADFACVGMFDFQVAEDISIAKKILAGLNRKGRPWCG